MPNTYLSHVGEIAIIMNAQLSVKKIPKILSVPEASKLLPALKDLFKGMPVYTVQAHFPFLTLLL